MKPSLYRICSARVRRSVVSATSNSIRAQSEALTSCISPNTSVRTASPKPGGLTAYPSPVVGNAGVVMARPAFGSPIDCGSANVQSTAPSWSAIPCRCSELSLEPAAATGAPFQTSAAVKVEPLTSTLNVSNASCVYPQKTESCRLPSPSTIITHPGPCVIQRKTSPQKCSGSLISSVWRWRTSPDPSDEGNSQ